MIKTSTEITSASSIIGEERAVELVAKAGFDAWDFSQFRMVKYNWETQSIFKDYTHPLCEKNANSFAKKLRKIGEDNGIYCNQSHAPFPTCCKDIRDLFKKSIELTAIAGGKICVIHPNNNFSAQKNAEMYFELLPFAKEHNVKIATENMWNWEGDEACFAACSNEKSFKEHLDIINDDYFVACVDIGHAEMKGLDTSAEKMLRFLSNKVQALHIHDNDLWHDCHQIPFSMKIDFNNVIKTLKEINYCGELTLEADTYLKSFGCVENPSKVIDGLKNMYNSADRLRKMFEEK